MIPRVEAALPRSRGEVQKERKNRAGEDSEIKGPGPFGSMALMVLRKFRDLAWRRGPGFPRFSSTFRDLSGTWLPRRSR